jgi:hypothetical protein
MPNESMRTDTRLLLKMDGEQTTVVYRLGTETENLRASHRWQPIPSANIRDQRLATLDFPSGPTLSRVRCIAWFRHPLANFRVRNHSRPNDHH